MTSDSSHIKYIRIFLKQKLKIIVKKNYFFICITLKNVKLVLIIFAIKLIFLNFYITSYCVWIKIVEFKKIDY